ncbi:hypothetical protein BsWGS_03230 [Bradybaena similaris]
MDFTKFETDRKGFQNLLVITDIFSKFTVAIPTKDQKASTVAKCLLERWIYYFGAPLKLHSDQGKNFESQLIQELCKMYGIHKTRTSPFNPAANGVTERMNRTIQNMLRTLDDREKENWSEHINELIMVYNSTPHAVTGFSPYFLIHGRESILPIDFMLRRTENEGSDDLDKWLEVHKENLKTAHEIARRNLQTSAEKRKAHADEKNRIPLLQVGDQVRKKKHYIGLAKLQDVWSTDVYTVVRIPEATGGPYMIRDKNNIELRVSGHELRRIEKSESDSVNS